jgi:hypothetical protein
MIAPRWFLPFYSLFYGLLKVSGFGSISLLHSEYASFCCNSNSRTELRAAATSQTLLAGRIAADRQIWLVEPTTSGTKLSPLLSQLAFGYTKGSVRFR